jgi:hypothetical protein
MDKKSGGFEVNRNYDEREALRRGDDISDADVWKFILCAIVGIAGLIALPFAMLHGLGLLLSGH